MKRQQQSDQSPRVLPWQTWEEWAMVRDALFDDGNPAVQQAALLRVSVWRVRGRVPHAVDASAQLVELALYDPGAGPGGFPHEGLGLGLGGGAASGVGAGFYSEQMLQSAYAMSVVRAVNGIADGGQKGSHATSVAVLAGRAGLPASVVDLRHDASHNALPALPALRLAAGQLRRWFWERYWAPQGAALASIEQSCSLVLQRYMFGGPRGEGHRHGTDEEALRVTLAAIPAATLAHVLVPLLVAPLYDDSKNDEAIAAVGWCTGGAEEKKQEAIPRVKPRQEQLLPDAAVRAALNATVSAPLLTPFDASLRAAAAGFAGARTNPYPCTFEGVFALYDKVEPLLSSLQAQWPGFSRALLTALVEALLVSSNSSNNDSNNGSNNGSGGGGRDRAAAYRFFHLAWVKLLLSREWVARLVCPLPVLSASAAAAATAVAAATASSSFSSSSSPSPSSSSLSPSPSLLSSSSPAPPPTTTVASNKSNAYAAEAHAASAASANSSTSSSTSAAFAAASRASRFVDGDGRAVCLRRVARAHWTPAQRRFMLATPVPRHLVVPGHAPQSGQSGHDGGGPAPEDARGGGAAAAAAAASSDNLAAGALEGARLIGLATFLAATRCGGHEEEQTGPKTATTAAVAATTSDKEGSGTALRKELRRCLEMRWETAASGGGDRTANEAAVPGLQDGGGGGGIDGDGDGGGNARAAKRRERILARVTKAKARRVNEPEKANAVDAGAPPIEVASSVSVHSVPPRPTAKVPRQSHLDAHPHPWALVGDWPPCPIGSLPGHTQTPIADWS
jgi:hypothetical protein